MTTMCVQYRPTLIAALAIYVACKWSGWQVNKYNYYQTEIEKDI